MSVLLSIEAPSHNAGVPNAQRVESSLWVAARKAGKRGRRRRRGRGERGKAAAAVDITVATPSSARARRLREADHHRERTRAA
jgi:hypothetical protein